MNVDLKTCEICNHDFVCNTNNISNCLCSQMLLSSEARQYIKTHYADCLCLSCLKKINDEIGLDTQFLPQTTSADLSVCQVKDFLKR